MCSQGERLCYIMRHIFSFYLEEYSHGYSPKITKSNVVVAGVPTKNYKIPSEWIQPNTTILNVASFKNVNESEILQIEGVQYIPQVGKVTGEKISSIPIST